MAPVTYQTDLSYLFPGDPLQKTKIDSVQDVLVAASDDFQHGATIVNNALSQQTLGVTTQFAVFFGAAQDVTAAVLTYVAGYQTVSLLPTVLTPFDGTTPDALQALLALTNRILLMAGKLGLDALELQTAGSSPSVLGLGSLAELSLADVQSLSTYLSLKQTFNDVDHRLLAFLLLAPSAPNKWTALASLTGWSATQSATLATSLWGTGTGYNLPSGVAILQAAFACTKTLGADINAALTLAGLSQLAAFAASDLNRGSERVLGDLPNPIRRHAQYAQTQIFRQSLAGRPCSHRLCRRRPSARGVGDIGDLGASTQLPRYHHQTRAQRICSDRRGDGVLDHHLSDRRGDRGRAILYAAMPAVVGAFRHRDPLPRVLVGVARQLSAVGGQPQDLHLSGELPRPQLAQDQDPAFRGLAGKADARRDHRGKRHPGLYRLSRRLRPIGPVATRRRLPMHGPRSGQRDGLADDLRLRADLHPTVHLLLSAVRDHGERAGVVAMDQTRDDHRGGDGDPDFRLRSAVPALGGNRYRQ